MTDPIDNLRDLLKRIKSDAGFQSRVAVRTERSERVKRSLGREREMPARAYGPRHLARTAARKAVAWAVKRGTLVKPKRCHVNDHCVGNSLFPFHWHGCDAAHRLDVVWLCARHRAMADSGSLKIP